MGIFLVLPHPSTGDFRSKLARVDFLGAGTLVCAIFLLLLGLDRGGNISWSDRITIVSLSVSAVFFAAFVSVELWIAREPFAPKRIVSNPSLIASYLCNLFSIAAGVTIIFHVSLYLQAVQGASAREVGLVLIPAIIGAVFGSLSTGLIMQATGKYYVLTVTLFVLMLAGNVLVALVTGIFQYSLLALTIGELPPVYAFG